jgi:putative phage-type endonuclease
MKEAEVTQDSDEWHSWRKRGVGSSEIPAIMGSSPYCSREQLLEERVRPWLGSDLTFPMRYGKAMEPIVRRMICDKKMLQYDPCCFEGKVAHFHASLDAYCRSTHEIVEIKCPLSRERMGEAAMGIIGDDWRDQVLWQMAVMDCSDAAVAVWSKECQKIFWIPVVADEKRVQLMMKEAQDFWEQLQELTADVEETECSQ